MNIKRCQTCDRVSHQGYNGHYYCNEHHPQRLCAECGVNLRDGFSMRPRLCEPCEKKRKQEILQREKSV